MPAPKQLAGICSLGLMLLVSSPFAQSESTKLRQMADRLTESLEAETGCPRCARPR